MTKDGSSRGYSSPLPATRRPSACEADRRARPSFLLSPGQGEITPCGASSPCCFLCCLFPPRPSRSASIPADVVYAYEVDPARGLYDRHAPEHRPSFRRRAGPSPSSPRRSRQSSTARSTQTLIIPRADIDKGAQRLAAMEAQGILKAYDFHFQTSRYLDGNPPVRHPHVGAGNRHRRLRQASVARRPAVGRPRDHRPRQGCRRQGGRSPDHPQGREPSIAERVPLSARRHLVRGSGAQSS